jgi:hypothetical protein
MEPRLRRRAVAVIVGAALHGISGYASAQQPGHLIGGFTAPHIFLDRPELRGVTDGDALFHRKIELARDDARFAYEHGGRMLRVFYAPSMFESDLSFPFGITRAKGDVSPTDLATIRKYHEHGTMPVYMDTIENRLKVLDLLDGQFDELLQALPRGRGLSGKPLDLRELDAYVQGVAAFNTSLPPGAKPLRILLCLVLSPPQDVLEAPSIPLLGYFKRKYSFDTLWGKFVRINIALTRLLVRRYATNADPWPGQPTQPIVTAFELINEPDSNWIPDEFRIEHALRPEANPLGKYVTELHLPEIATGSGPFQAFEKTPWGFQPEQGGWPAAQVVPEPVLEYDWGPKFDWYVKAAAQLTKELAVAVKSEGAAAKCDVTTVSGGVTHNNVDFLIRMYRQEPEVYRWIDAIAVHPYHWNNHDIWDKAFVSSIPKDDWRNVTPAEFARHYLKRFDFLEEVAKLTRAPDAERGFGLQGKTIWVTEFGIPTKKLGEANRRELAPFMKFIKERREVPLPDGIPSVDWEDLWDAFFAQVDGRYLERNNVSVFLFYALREAGIEGVDLDDQDRSNMALLHRDGSPRMAPETATNLDRFMQSLMEPR